MTLVLALPMRTNDRVTLYIRHTLTQYKRHLFATERSRPSPPRSADYLER
jgi:hypothetical protein